MPYLSPQELIESSAITKLAPRNTAGGYYWAFPAQRIGNLKVGKLTYRIKIRGSWINLKLCIISEFNRTSDWLCWIAYCLIEKQGYQRTRRYCIGVFFSTTRCIITSSLTCKYHTSNFTSYSYNCARSLT